MQKLFRLAQLGLLATVLPASAATISVEFIHPEKYTDAGYSSSLPGERERAEVQREIEQHLRRLAERSLAASDALEIQVLDIDLAGHFEPFRFRGTSEVRVVREVTVPRIKLHYTLRRGDQVLASAEEHLSDMNFLLNRNRYADGDRLRYEKAMLDEWFRSRIGHPRRDE